MNFKNTNILFLIFLATIFAFSAEDLSIRILYFIIPLVLIYSLIIAWGSYSIQSNFFFKSINKNKKGLCLTFDDGPHPEYTPLILDILKKHQVKATFFLIGKQIQGNEHILQRMVKEGHVIGNHTWNHSYTTALMTGQKMDLEIKKTNEAIFASCGVKPIIFRPPFGVTNPIIGRKIKENLMHSIGWDIRSYDTTAKSSQQLKDRILSGVEKNGSILLMHDNREITVQTLDDLLVDLKSRNVIFAEKVTG